jgi:CHASE3 domain sensor protein
VLVAISATSVILVDQAREDNAWVVHTVEVENQISTLLLQIRNAESAARGYLLTADAHFLAEHEASVASIVPAIDKLARLAGDNPLQIENSEKLRAPIQERLIEFAKAIEFVKRSDGASGIALLRQSSTKDSIQQIEEIAGAMRVEEDRLLSLRTAAADRTQRLASSLQSPGRAS